MGDFFDDGLSPAPGPNPLDPLDLRKSGATAATQQAAQLQTQAAQRALAEQQRQYEETQANLAPYLYAGYQAVPYVTGGATPYGFGSMLAYIMGAGPEYRGAPTAVPTRPQLPPMQAPGTNLPGNRGNVTGGGSVGGGANGGPATGGAAGQIGGPFPDLPPQGRPDLRDPKSMIAQGAPNVGGSSLDRLRYDIDQRAGRVSEQEAAALRAYQQGGSVPAGLTTGGAPTMPGAVATQMGFAPQPQPVQQVQPKSRAQQLMEAAQGYGIAPQQQVYAKGALPGETRQTEDQVSTPNRGVRPPIRQPGPVTPPTSTVPQSQAPQARPGGTGTGSGPLQIGFTITPRPDGGISAAPINPNRPLQTMTSDTSAVFAPKPRYIPGVSPTGATGLPDTGFDPAAQAGIPPTQGGNYAPKPPYIPGVTPTGATGQPATGFDPRAQANIPPSSAYQPGTSPGTAFNPYAAIVEERRKEAQDALSRAGLTRSGSAAMAAAEIPIEVATQIENLLYGRQQQLAGSGQNAAVQQGGFGAQTAGRIGDLQGQIGAALGQGALGQAQIRAQATQNLVNIAGTIASAYFSDPRLKTNMQPIGQIGDLTLYEWDWIEGLPQGIGKMAIGFSADEVAAKYPHHVREVAGFKMIDYHALNKQLREELENAY